MTVYRIVKSEFADKLYSSGRPNRWNIRGDYVLYTASSRSLATLELYVHRSGINLAKNEFKVMVIEIDEKATMQVVEQKQLSITWRSMRGYAECQNIGHTWVEERKNLLLQVPSAIIPKEHNYVINTEHKDYKQLVNLKEIEPYAFDGRLF